MSLFEFFLILSGMIILILGFDILKRERLNGLHFLVFFFIGGGLLVFTFFPSILQKIGNVFGLQRGADLLVYASIIFLIYSLLAILRKVEHAKHEMTQLIREIALQNSKKQKLDDREIFLIPCYNEAAIITQTLDTIWNSWYHCIVVVNDGSKDATREILESYPHEIICLHHYKNRGQGAALETWFEYVRRYGSDYSNVVTFDADGQHNIWDIQNFRKALTSDTDVLLGSRFMKGASTNISLKKKIILKTALCITRLLSKIEVTDTHNGYRYIKKTALKDIHLTIEWMGHASEILDIIAQKKLRYKEVPVHIEYTQYSLSKWQRVSNSWNILSRFVWMKFFR